jgi:putative tricarboxylic transport membrane protein
METQKDLVSKNGDLIITAALMAFAVIITVSSFRLGLGSLGRPGAGLMPFGLGIILFLCSVGILVLSRKNLRKIKKREERVWAEVDFRKIALVIASLFGYLILLERLGFPLTASLVLLVLFKVVGSQKWYWALISTALTVSLVYLFFVIILDVYMPLFPFTMG